MEYFDIFAALWFTLWHQSNIDNGFDTHVCSFSHLHIGEEFIPLILGQTTREHISHGWLDDVEWHVGELKPHGDFDHRTVSEERML